MKFKTYRRLDLLIIAILSFGMELLATYLTNNFLPTIAPYPVVGLLLALVATTRWGLEGLIVAPFSVLGNFISGKFMIPQKILRDSYNLLWIIGILYVSSLVSALLLYKKNGWKQYTSKISSILSLDAIIIVSSLTLTTLGMIFYNVIVGTGLNFVGIGQLLYSTLLYGSVGYVVLILGSLVLKSQGVLVNVKEKMISECNERKNEEKYYSTVKKTDDENK